jgi:hypothetical protein
MVGSLYELNSLKHKGFGNLATFDGLAALATKKEKAQDDEYQDFPRKNARKLLGHPFFHIQSSQTKFSAKVTS